MVLAFTSRFYETALKQLKKIPEHITSIERLLGIIPNGLDLNDVKAKRLSR